MGSLQEACELKIILSNFYELFILCIEIAKPSCQSCELNLVHQNKWVLLIKGDVCFFSRIIFWPFNMSYIFHIQCNKVYLQINLQLFAFLCFLTLNFLWNRKIHFAYVSDLLVSKQYGKTFCVLADFPVHHQIVGIILSLGRDQSLRVSSSFFYSSFLTFHSTLDIGIQNFVLGK